MRSIIKISILVILSTMVYTKQNAITDLGIDYLDNSCMQITKNSKGKTVCQSCYQSNTKNVLKCVKSDSVLLSVSEQFNSKAYNYVQLCKKDFKRTEDETKCVPVKSNEKEVGCESYQTGQYGSICAACSPGYWPEFEQEQRPEISSCKISKTVTHCVLSIVQKLTSGMTSRCLVCEAGYMVQSVSQINKNVTIGCIRVSKASQDTGCIHKSISKDENGKIISTKCNGCNIFNGYSRNGDLHASTGRDMCNKMKMN